jgi:hypothetical protein
MMRGMIHVLRVTATAAEAENADAGARQSLIVFVRSADAESSYAPAEALLRQAGWTDVDLGACKPVSPDAVEKLDESLQNAYRDAAARGAAAVLLSSK